MRPRALVPCLLAAGSLLAASACGGATPAPQHPSAAAGAPAPVGRPPTTPTPPSTRTNALPPSSPGTPTSAADSRLAGVSCPAAYLPSDSARPSTQLDLTVSPDLATVTGTETVRFTPDAPVSELDFRLWANGPEGGRSQGRIDITAVRTTAGLTPRTARLGGRAGTSGTLLVVPLSRTFPAGTTITAAVDFTLRLPPARLDRLGVARDHAWWASAHPVLAWVRGRGWVRDPASIAYGETQTSEASRVDLSVRAPTSETVLANGVGQTPVPAGSGYRRWRFTAAAARDVAVAVGPFRTLVRRLPVAGGGDMPVTVAALPGSHRDLATMMFEQSRALSLLQQRLGPYPFEQLTDVALPELAGSGIEYPGLELLSEVADGGFSGDHETVHQWFYGLVGDDQARDPWLDESFATFEQALLDQQTAQYADGALNKTPMGSSLTSFGADSAAYFFTVYDKGAWALVAARSAAGPDRFDAALRCYLRWQAWRVASPSAVANALRGLPVALGVLRRAGAFVAGDAGPSGSSGS